MYNIVYTDIHFYDLAREMGRKALQLAEQMGKNKRVWMNLRKDWLGESGPGTVPVRKLVKTALADPSFSRGVRPVSNQAKLLIAGRGARGSTPSSSVNVYPTKIGRKTRMGVHLLIPSNRGNRSHTPVIAHELGHALDILRVPGRSAASFVWSQSNRRSAGLRDFVVEIRANRLGAALYEKAGGRAQDYWKRMVPALTTYAPASVRVRRPRIPKNYKETP